MLIVCRCEPIKVVHLIKCLVCSWSEIVSAYDVSMTLTLMLNIYEDKELNIYEDV